MRTHSNFYAHSNSYLYSNSYVYEYAHATSFYAISYPNSRTLLDSH
jgi:hypothetical protein